MGKQRIKRRGIVRLSDIRDNCRIDAEIGCWLWAGCVSSNYRTVMPVLHLSERCKSPYAGRQMPAARAAWMLAGNPLEPHQVVWKAVCNVGLCVNPAHCKMATRPEMIAEIVASGRNRNRPERAAVNLANRSKMMISVEKVQAVEAMFATGATTRAVRQAFTMSSETAKAIRIGQHPHSSHVQKVLPNASVFNWRP